MVGEDVGKTESLSTAFWEFKAVQPLWRTERWFLKKLKIELYGSAIPHLDTYAKELKAGTGMVTCIPTTIHSSEKVEATHCPSTDEELNEMWYR